MATIVKTEFGHQNTDSETESETCFEGPGSEDVSASSRAKIPLTIETGEGFCLWSPSGEDDDMDWDEHLKKSIENDVEFKYEAPQGPCDMTSSLAGAVSDGPASDCGEIEVIAEIMPIKRTSPPAADVKTEVIATELVPTKMVVSIMEVEEMPLPKTYLNELHDSFERPMTFDFPAVKIEIVDVAPIGPENEDNLCMEVDVYDPSEFEGQEVAHDSSSVAHVPLSTANPANNSDDSCAATTETTPSIPSTSTSMSSELVLSASSSVYLSEGSEPADVVAPPSLPVSRPLNQEEAVALLRDATKPEVLQLLSEEQRQRFSCLLIGAEDPETTGRPTFVQGQNPPKSADTHTEEDDYQVFQCLKRVQGGPRCLYECRTYTQLMDHRKDLHNDLPTLQEFEVHRGSLRSQSMLLCRKYNALDRPCRRLCNDQLDLVNHGVRQIHKKEVFIMRTFCSTCNTSFSSRDATLLHMLRYQDKCVSSD